MVDIAENQIAAAKKFAEKEGLDIEFGALAAEDIKYPDGSFDVISAGQSWLYFDKTVMIPKVLELLKEDGCFVLTHLLWLPLKDRIAAETEALVLEHNPEWQSGGYEGNLPSMFEWARDDFDLKTFHSVEADLEFTRESWRGRIRACRGVGASMNLEEVERFDTAHQKLLESIAPENSRCFIK